MNSDSDSSNSAESNSSTLRRDRKKVVRVNSGRKKGGGSSASASKSKKSHEEKNHLSRGDNETDYVCEQCGHSPQKKKKEKKKPRSGAGGRDAMSDGDGEENHLGLSFTTSNSSSSSSGSGFEKDKKKTSSKTREDAYGSFGQDWRAPSPRGNNESFSSHRNQSNNNNNYSNSSSYHDQHEYESWGGHDTDFIGKDHSGARCWVAGCNAEVMAFCSYTIFWTKGQMDKYFDSNGSMFLLSPFFLLSFLCPFPPSNFCFLIFIFLVAAAKPCGRGLCAKHSHKQLVTSSWFCEECDHDITLVSPQDIYQTIVPTDTQCVVQ